MNSYLLQQFYCNNGSCTFRRQESGVGDGARVAFSGPLTPTKTFKTGLTKGYGKSQNQNDYTVATATLQYHFQASEKSACVPKRPAYTKGMICLTPPKGVTSPQGISPPPQEEYAHPSEMEASHERLGSSCTSWPPVVNQPPKPENKLVLKAHVTTFQFATEIGGNTWTKAFSMLTINKTFSGNKPSGRKNKFIRGQDIAIERLAFYKPLFSLHLLPENVLEINDISEQSHNFKGLFACFSEQA